MASGRGVGGTNLPQGDPRSIASVSSGLIPGQRIQAASGAPQFVNIAAASQRPPQVMAHSGGQLRAAAAGPTLRMMSPVQEGLQGQPAVQTMQNPPFAHGAHGAINLTITNGAVNLRPGGPGVTIRPEAVSQGQALIRANITGPGSLQRIPIMPANVSQPQAINLKIQNPINLRLTGPSGNLIQAGKSGATIIGQRPAMLINASQLSGIRPVHGAGQMPMVQAVPQSVAGPLGSLTVLPQGARFSGNIPLAQLPVHVSGKLPIRALQSGAIRHASAAQTLASAHQMQQRSVPSIIQRNPSTGGSGSARNSPVRNSSVSSVPTNVTVNAIQHGQPVTLSLTPLQTPKPLTNASIIFTAAQASNMTAPVILNTPLKHLSGSQVCVRTLSSVPGPNEQMEATDLSKKSPLSEDICSSSVTQEIRPKQPNSTVEQASDLSVKSSTQSSAKGSSRTDSESKRTDRRSADINDSVLNPDIESSLEWKDGVGVLPGSDIKFRKNEFGVIEMMDDDELLECGETFGDNDVMDDDMDDVMNDGEVTGRTDSPATAGDSTTAKESESSAQVPDSGGFVSCKNCGIYAPPDEFLEGTKFCSKNCLARFKARSAKKRADSVGSAPGSTKKKKRKMSDNVAEENKESIKDGEDMEFSSVASTTPKKESENAVNLKTKTTLSSGGKRGKSFSWSSYLAQENGVAAPNACFKEYQDIPEGKNGFRVGMRLEAVDPRHPSHYCACSVVEIRGYRLRLRFDGYSESYDFWVNADSPFIFHTGWSEKNGKFLDPPKDYANKALPFEWPDYLRQNRYVAAPKNLFQTTSTTSVTPHGFRTGMKLEAVDKKNSSLICVATVADVLGDHVLIHFDGWEDVYDYWCDPGSPYIHPVGWCQTNGVPLSPPKDWKDIENFTWEEYLSVENASAVPPRAFKPRQPNNFEEGMHLEIVDKRNPVLIRAAKIVQVESYSVTIHFCGWSDAYDYVLDDDSAEMHPCGWCAKTGHLLTPPLTARDLAEKSEGCPTPGCTGVGHVKGARFTGHHSAFGCPYSQLNMNKDSCLLDRLSPGRPDFENGYSKKARDEGCEEVAGGRKSKSPEDKIMLPATNHNEDTIDEEDEVLIEHAYDSESAFENETACEQNESETSDNEHLTQTALYRSSASRSRNNRKQEEKAHRDEEKADMHFVLSLLPQLKKLNNIQKMAVKVKMMQLLIEASYPGSEDGYSVHSRSSHNATPQAIFRDAEYVPPSTPYARCDSHPPMDLEHANDLHLRTHSNQSQVPQSFIIEQHFGHASTNSSTRGLNHSHSHDHMNIQYPQYQNMANVIQAPNQTNASGYVEEKFNSSVWKAEPRNKGVDIYSHGEMYPAENHNQSEDVSEGSLQPHISGEPHLVTHEGGQTNGNQFQHSHPQIPSLQVPVGDDRGLYEAYVNTQDIPNQLQPQQFQVRAMPQGIHAQNTGQQIEHGRIEEYKGNVVWKKQEPQRQAEDDERGYYKEYEGSSVWKSKPKLTGPSEDTGTDPCGYMKENKGNLVWKAKPTIIVKPGEAVQEGGIKQAYRGAVVWKSDPKPSTSCENSASVQIESLDKDTEEKNESESDNEENESKVDKERNVHDLKANDVQNASNSYTEKDCDSSTNKERNDSENINIEYESKVDIESNIQNANNSNREKDCDSDTNHKQSSDSDEVKNDKEQDSSISKDDEGPSCESVNYSSEICNDREYQPPKSQESDVTVTNFGKTSAAEFIKSSVTKQEQQSDALQRNEQRESDLSQNFEKIDLKESSQLDSDEQIGLGTGEKENQIDSCKDIEICSQSDSSSYVEKIIDECATTDAGVQEPSESGETIENDINSQ